MQQLNLTPQQALQKIKHYCAYQERCHSEVATKLYSYGLHKNDVDQIVSSLIEENYLNEERFAIQFAGGHFRIKNWGKVKIKQHLKQKYISEYCIKKALQSIDEDEYLQSFKKIATAKLQSLKSEKNIFIKKKKLQQYLLQKGFETVLINDIITSPLK